VCQWPVAPGRAFPARVVRSYEIVDALSKGLGCAPQRENRISFRAAAELIDELPRRQRQQPILVPEVTADRDGGYRDDEGRRLARAYAADSPNVSRPRAAS